MHSETLRIRAKRKSKEALISLIVFAALSVITYFTWPSLIAFVLFYFAFLAFVGTVTNFSKAACLYADSDDAARIENEPRL